MKGHMTSESMYRLIGKVAVRRLTTAVLSRRAHLYGISYGPFQRAWVERNHDKGSSQRLEDFQDGVLQIFCDGKTIQGIFQYGKHTTKFLINYVHSYVWGPSREQSLGGYKEGLTSICYKEKL